MGMQETNMTANFRADGRKAANAVVCPVDPLPAMQRERHPADHTAKAQSRRAAFAGRHPGGRDIHPTIKSEKRMCA